MKLKTSILCMAAVLGFSLTGCSNTVSNVLNTEKEETYNVVDIGTIGIPTETEPPTEPPFEKADVSFVAVGDNLIHTCVYKTASDHAADGIVYDFDYCYQHIEDRISAADLAFINQETLICDGKLELSGSNLNFNSPVELGYNLVDAGFDIFSMANNHVLDKGTEGLEYTLDYWDKIQQSYRDTVVMGVYRNEQDMENYRIIEKDGLKIGCLAYTYHTNGYVLPEDTSLIIPYMEEEGMMQRQISELSQQVDCLVVSMHWGTEDTHEVDDEVRELAQKVINWGADVIIGTGPHTLQTMEYLTRPDGSQGFVFYSLGNFISGQTDNFNMVGGMGEFRICRDDQGNIKIQDVGLTPLINHYESGMTNVQVYPYDQYTSELLEQHYIPYAPSGNYKSWNWEIIDNIIEENVPEQYRKNYTHQAAVPDTEEFDDDDGYDD